MEKELRNDDHLAAVEDNHDVEARLDQQLIEQQRAVNDEHGAVIDLIKRTGGEYVNVIFLGRSYLYDPAYDLRTVLVVTGPGRGSYRLKLGEDRAPGNEVDGTSTV